MVKILIKNIISLFLLTIFLSGCFQETIIMNSKSIDSKNLSGTINFKIQYNNDFLSSIKFHDKTDNIDIKNFKLLDKNEFQKQLNSNKKLSLVNYLENNLVIGKTYDITVSFLEIEELTKKINPFFIDNYIFSEKDTVYCQSKLSLNCIGDPQKIREQYSSLNEDEKNVISPYLAVIKFKLIYIIPSQIIVQSSTNGDFSAEPLSIFSSNVFENDILNKLKKDDKELLLSYYKKEKNTYLLKSNFTEEDKQQIVDLLLSAGFKNKAVYEYSLVDLLSLQKNIEVNVAYKR